MWYKCQIICWCGWVYTRKPHLKVCMNNEPAFSEYIIHHINDPQGHSWVKSTLPSRSLATLQAVDQQETMINCNSHAIVKITCIHIELRSINIRYIPNSDLMKIWKIYALNLLYDQLCNVKIVNKIAVGLQIMHNRDFLRWNFHHEILGPGRIQIFWGFWNLAKTLINLLPCRGIPKQPISQFWKLTVCITSTSLQAGSNSPI